MIIINIIAWVLNVVLIVDAYKKAVVDKNPIISIIKYSRYFALLRLCAVFPNFVLYGIGESWSKGFVDYAASVFIGVISCIIFVVLCVYIQRIFKKLVASQSKISERS